MANTSPANGAQAIGYLSLDITGFEEAISTAKKALVGLGAAFAAFKTIDFWKEGIQGAIEFGNQAYFAAQKINGYDPGKLFIVQKALQAGGLSADEARGKIEEFAFAGRDLSQLFKGGQSGFSDALTKSAKEYGTQAAILSTSAEKFAVVQGKINALGTKLQGFFLGLADSILTPLSKLLAQLDQIDLVSIGQQFGKYITDAIDTITGLLANKDLFEAISLGLKVGFQEAIVVLAGGINSVFGALKSASFWSGLGKTIVGSLAVVGTYLTSIFFELGKILIASVQAAEASLENQFPNLKNLATGAEYATKITALSLADSKLSPMQVKGMVLRVMAHEQGPSTNIAENLKNINSNSNIQAQNSVMDGILKKSKDTALSGVSDLISTGKNISISLPAGSDIFPDFNKNQKTFSDLLAKAQATGSAQNTFEGNKNPLYNIQSQPFHVIADSLARVGGGGRYVRTGLSIAEQAAVQAAQTAKQQLAVQQAMDKKLGVISMGGAHGVGIGF